MRLKLMLEKPHMFYGEIINHLSEKREWERESFHKSREDKNENVNFNQFHQTFSLRNYDALCDVETSTA